LLKLKRVQMLGFKSFCDRTNISDAIMWVLGEQSAKSLRGGKMEDVIFAGTRDRKATGMAEVSLTLVDPEVYDGAVLGNDFAGEGDWSSDGSSERALDLAGDWDEAELRQMRAAETEEAVAEAQPGVVIGIEQGTEGAQTVPGAGPVEVEGSVEGVHDPNGVVLKIRRRKFGRSPVRAGEVTITRRLFRSGDSEYLLNGKICRLRDIQDIFMGTGLGGRRTRSSGRSGSGRS
jgi:chromosome segregation protein